MFYGRDSLIFIKQLLTFIGLTSGYKLKSFYKWVINPFSTNVSLMYKPGSWFLLVKCLKNTCGSKNGLRMKMIYLNSTLTKSFT